MPYCLPIPRKTSGTPAECANCCSRSVDYAANFSFRHCFCAISPFHLLYAMEAGTTSATTFKLRAGASTGTQTFNGTLNARELGGSYNSYLRIREKMG